jgi:uncharacterized coiled-coil protein SlyX
MPPDTRQLREVAVADQDRVTDEVNASLTARVTTSAITNAHTARLTVEFTNTASRERTIRFPSDPPFPPGPSVERDPGLLLLPSDASVDRRHPDCWQPTETPTLTTPLSLSNVVLRPDECVSCTRDIWGDPDNDPGVCVPVGAFRFETTYRVGGHRFDWGFTLAVDEP